MTTEQFHYTHKGQEIVLPPLRSLKAGLLRKVRRLSADDQLFTILEETVDDDTLAVIDDMDAEQLGEFFDGWQKHSGINLGESTASSTS